jgi:uncharacterized phage protein (TIGR02218 family)
LHIKLPTGAGYFLTDWDVPITTLADYEINSPTASPVPTYSTASVGLVADISTQLNGPIDDTQLDLALDSNVVADDIRRGHWRGGSVIVGFIDPNDLDNPWSYAFFDIGNIEIEGLKVQIELLGPERRLEQPIGRILTANCPWAFGDKDCGVALDTPGEEYQIDGIVSGVTDRKIFAATSSPVGQLTGASPANYYQQGFLTWTTGANTSDKHKVEENDGAGGVTLSTGTFDDIQIGDTFILTAGCDHSLATCRDKYNNVANFGGFPYLTDENATASAKKG